MGPLRKQAAYKLYRLLPANCSRPYHLLDPAPRLQSEIDRMRDRLPARFVAVHRRTEMRRLYSCHVSSNTTAEAKDDGGDDADSDGRKCVGVERPPYCCMYLPYIRQVAGHRGVWCSACP